MVKQSLFLATSNYDELLPRYKNLLSLIHNDTIQRPVLPEGLVEKVSNTFDICGWDKCRVFLVSLGNKKFDYLLKTKK